MVKYFFSVVDARYIVAYFGCGCHGLVLKWSVQPFLKLFTSTIEVGGFCAFGGT